MKPRPGPASSPSDSDVKPARSENSTVSSRVSPPRLGCLVAAGQLVDNGRRQVEAEDLADEALLLVGHGEAVAEQDGQGDGAGDQRLDQGQHGVGLEQESCRARSSRGRRPDSPSPAHSGRIASERIEARATKTRPRAQLASAGRNCRALLADQVVDRRRLHQNTGERTAER